jgi:cell division septal protein FtsQ
MIQRRARRTISLLWLYLLVGAGVAMLGWMEILEIHW